VRPKIQLFVNLAKLSQAKQNAAVAPKCRKRRMENRN
jgi:hypothetical protein